MTFILFYNNNNEDMIYSVETNFKIGVKTNCNIEKVCTDLSF